MQTCPSGIIRQIKREGGPTMQRDEHPGGGASCSAAISSPGSTPSRRRPATAPLRSPPTSFRLSPSAVSHPHLGPWKRRSVLLFQRFHRKVAFDHGGQRIFWASPPPWSSSIRRCWRSGAGAVGLLTLHSRPPSPSAGWCQGSPIFPAASSHRAQPADGQRAYKPARLRHRSDPQLRRQNPTGLAIHPDG